MLLCAETKEMLPRWDLKSSFLLTLAQDQELANLILPEDSASNAKFGRQ